MKIRIIDTITEPNQSGTANINDEKSVRLMDLFLVAHGKSTNLPLADKLDTVARELKKYMIRVAREQLRSQRFSELEDQLIIDSNFD